LIREAAPEDLAAIVAIYNAAIPGGEATADTEPVPVEARRTWFTEHSPDRRPLWVFDAGGVAGWLSFEDFYGRPAYGATAEVGVYVAPERRREGIGRALLRHALERAPELGLSTLLGLVFAHNAASVALLGRLGFEQWGRLPRVARIDGRGRDVLVLGRRVGGPY